MIMVVQNTVVQIMEDFFYCWLLHNGCSSDNHQKFPIATGCIASIMHEHSTKPHLSYKTGLDVMQMCRMRFANTADFPDMYIQCWETSYQTYSMQYGACTEKGGSGECDNFFEHQGICEVRICMVTWFIDQ